MNLACAARVLCLMGAAIAALPPDPAAAQAASAPTRPALTEADVASVVDPVMNRWIGQHKGPGAVVVVVGRDGPIFARGYGLSDIAAKTPFTADATLVRPGSISKLFTAIAVMQLVDAGKLDLDRDVNDYIDFVIPMPHGGVAVTLRRLLTHRAGFEEHFKDLFSRSGEPEALDRWLKRGLPRRLFPGGDVEAYSNYGVALAGYVVERVSGEPFAAYVQRHILDPLGMYHSTFQQPLPDELAPLMAKGYRRSDQPPLGFFETIAATPAGGLSATGADMGRFIRALMNGGELDGARILPKARLDQMTAPGNATPAGYLGLAFFGRKIAGHDAIGHEGGTIVFFSDLKFFPEEGLGVFVSLDGVGDATRAADMPHIVEAIATHFLLRPSRAAPAPPAAGEAAIAGIYRQSRRADSTLVRLLDLISERVVRVDPDGNLRVVSAVWPFVNGVLFRRVGEDLYQQPVSGERIAFVDRGGESWMAEPSIQFPRAPRYLDVRWIAPALVASVIVALVTLLAWPFAAAWRRWRNKPWSPDRIDRRYHLAVRLVLLVDVAAFVAAAVLFGAALADLSVLSKDLDPAMLALYAAAWLGVLGAIVLLSASIKFWRNENCSRWSRVHHALIAVSGLMIAWFFVTFNIAGTTLVY